MAPVISYRLSSHKIVSDLIKERTTKIPTEKALTDAVVNLEATEKAVNHSVQLRPLKTDYSLLPNLSLTKYSKSDLKSYLLLRKNQEKKTEIQR